MAQRHPLVPGLCKEGEIIRGMHPRPRSLSEFLRRDQWMTARLDAGKQTIGALRLFRGALDHATHQKELRIVAAVKFAVNGFQ